VKRTSTCLDNKQPFIRCIRRHVVIQLSVANSNKQFFQVYRTTCEYFKQLRARAKKSNVVFWGVTPHPRKRHFYSHRRENLTPYNKEVVHNLMRGVDTASSTFAPSLVICITGRHPNLLQESG
jgi:hypothetical protein